MRFHLSRGRNDAAFLLPAESFLPAVASAEEGAKVGFAQIQLFCIYRAQHHSKITQQFWVMSSLGRA